MRHFLFVLPFIFLSHQMLFSQAGTLDPSFGNAGLVDIPTSASPESAAWGAEITEDGKVLAGGYAHAPFIVRILPNGTKDASFGQNGIRVYDQFRPVKMKALPGGKILLWGEGKIARLNADGSDDLSFEGSFPQGTIFASKAILQPDGKFLLALHGALAPLNQYCVARYLENGALDTDFGQGGFAYNESEWSGLAQDFAVQADGKILVTGSNGREIRSLARYHASGMPDVNFGENGISTWGDTVVAPPSWAIWVDSIRELPVAKKIRLQADGKILVATEETIFDTLNYTDWVPQVNIYRLNPDGTLDSTFGVNGLTNFTEIRSVYDVFLQEGGKIQIAGAMTYSESLSQILSNGTIDSGFGPAPVTENNIYLNDQGRIAFAQEANGNIIAAVSLRWLQQPMSSSPLLMFVKRLFTDGTVDNSFGDSNTFGYTPSYGNDSYYGMSMQPDGKMLLSGAQNQRVFCYNNYQTFNIPFVRRYNMDGTRDQQWGISPASFFTNYNPCNNYLSMNAAVALPDGKTLVIHSQNNLKIARFTSAPTLDNTFGTGGVAEVPFWIYKGTSAQPDGKIILIGTVQNGISVVCRYLENGNFDPAFGSGGIIQLTQIENCVGVTLLPNGKILVAGSGGQVAQLTSEGHLDGNFGENGIAAFPIVIHAIATHPSGKILLGGGDSEITIAEIAADGSGLNSSFGGGDGIVSFPNDGSPAYCNAIAIQPDGKIVATGTNNGLSKKLYLARYTAEGWVDSTFNGTGLQITDFGYQLNVPSNVAVQPNGKIVVGASIQQVTGMRISLLRYLSGLTVGTEHPELPKMAVMAFPNPFSNTLRLDFSRLPIPVANVEVYDLSGRQVFQAQTSAVEKMYIPESNNWIPGVYLLRATTASGVFVQKIVKQ